MRGSPPARVFDVEIVEARPGLLVFVAQGARARATFADEAGGHRWQRIPPNEKRGRMHTSTITVAVLREPSPVEVSVVDKDLEWSTCRGTGAGGQKRNKTESTVILTHRPSGVQVRCEADRSQLQNRAIALSLLRARLLAHAVAQRDAAHNAARVSQLGSGMRGDKRRTIRCQDGVVTDHVTGRTWQLKAYLRGAW